MDTFWTFINNKKKEKIENQYIYAEIPEYYSENKEKEDESEDSSVVILQIT